MGQASVFWRRCLITAVVCNHLSPLCFLVAGSEGKLTVVAQKMSVLSGEYPRRKLLLWWKKLSRRLNGRDLYLSL